MALKIVLKPHERMIIGGAVVAASAGTRCELIIENNIPVLRQKDIMTEDDADSSARRIYFVIQLMYIDEKNLIIHHNTYWKLVQDFIKAAPNTLGMIDQISEHILSSRYYQALKLAKKLINYEEEALARVRKSS